MNIDIENKEQLEKWGQEADSLFFGINLRDLDRDGLLAVIGNLVEESRRNKKFHKEHIDLLKMCRKL